MLYNHLPKTSEYKIVLSSPLLHATPSIVINESLGTYYNYIEGKMSRSYDSQYVRCTRQFSWTDTVLTSSNTFNLEYGITLQYPISKSYTTHNVYETFNILCPIKNYNDNKDHYIDHYFAFIEDIPTYYRHTITLTSSTNTNIMFTFTTPNKDNTDINSLTDLISKFGNTSIQGMGSDGTNTLAYLHIGTSATDTYFKTTTNQQVTLANSGFTNVADEVTTIS